MQDPKCDSKNNSLSPSASSLRAHDADAGELDDWDCLDTGTDATLDEPDYKPKLRAYTRSAPVIKERFI